MFLTDAQTDQRFVDMLRRLGWDVRTAHEENMSREPNDYVVAARARFLGRIFITFDHLRGESGAQVARELRERGGKLLKINIASGEIERSLGALYFHMPEWDAFFKRRENDGSGVVVIGSLSKPTGLRLYTPQQYLQRANPTGYQQFEEYLKKRKARTRTIHKRPTAKPAEQVAMDLGSHGEPNS